MVVPTTVVHDPPGQKGEGREMTSTPFLGTTRAAILSECQLSG